MKLSHALGLTSTVHQLLVKIDNHQAEDARLKGCLYCGGKLHWADYPRSPFGLHETERDNYQWRRSLCCADCRRRNTPQSVRFFGRRWYVTPVFILICALNSGWTFIRRAKIVKQYFGVTLTKRTWGRWCRWWRDLFVETAFWKKEKGLIPSARHGPFPRGLFGVFVTAWPDQLFSVLKCLAPLTAGAYRAV